MSILSNITLLTQGTGQLGKLMNSVERHLKARGFNDDQISEILPGIQEDLANWAAQIAKLTDAEQKELEKALLIAKQSVLKDTELDPLVQIAVLKALDKYAGTPSFWLQFIGSGFNLPTMLNTVLMIAFLIYMMAVV